MIDLSNSWSLKQGKNKEITILFSRTLWKTSRCNISLNEHHLKNKTPQMRKIANRAEWMPLSSSPA